MTHNLSDCSKTANSPFKSTRVSKLSTCRERATVELKWDVNVEWSESRNEGVSKSMDESKKKSGMAKVWRRKRAKWRARVWVEKLELYKDHEIERKRKQVYNEVKGM